MKRQIILFFEENDFYKLDTYLNDIEQEIMALEINLESLRFHYNQIRKILKEQ